MEDKIGLSNAEWKLMDYLWEESPKTIAAKHYYPIVEQSQACVQETKDFLERVYKGSMGLMLTTMVKQESISPEDLEELRRILNEGVDQHD